MLYRYLAALCFFFKQKTAYDMRISDWSSDVCSSDLLVNSDRHVFSEGWDSVRLLLKGDNMGFSFHITTIYEGAELRMHYKNHQIGRASCRERVCQYV